MFQVSAGKGRWWGVNRREGTSESLQLRSHPPQENQRQDAIEIKDRKPCFCSKVGSAAGSEVKSAVFDLASNAVLGG
eukprot:3690867-Rhodomonas_salina.1